MNRRNFLWKSGLALAGIAGASVTGRADSLGAGVNKGYFTLDVVTDRTDEAITCIQATLARYGHTGTVRFSESVLPGAAVGDIVFVQNGELVNIHMAAGGLGHALGQSARALGLPRRVERPVLLRFSAGAASRQAEYAEVHRGPLLIDRLPLNKDVAGHSIKTERGEILLTVSQGAVRISDASCKHKTCITMGRISKTGEQLVCIPNRIRVSLPGAQNMGVDGITQ